ncbi:MAG: hypothetical protein H8D82_00720, partial [Euryarchaeota archaeon]|nr:hypothetical protein [Euryarchaeota archaeon]
MEDEYNRAGRIASPIPLPIIKIEMETSDIATIWLQVPTKLAAEYKPGQYFMCWNPYDSNGGMSERNHNSEKPYSVGDIMIDTSKIDSKTAADSGKSGRALIGFTIKNLGRQSGDLTKMKCGDWLALRGPFGTTFPAIESSSTLLLVSGGIGSTPMHMAAFAARQKLGSKVVIHAIMGFRNEDETHYVSRMEEVSDTVTITTDDGSQGIHGYP